MEISHINDILPHVEGRDDFVIKRADGYSVIDYVYAGPDTFGHPARLECRGLKFGPDGALIARPLHKFFNVGERPETQSGVIDWGAPHQIVEKLDGSMIHPAIVDGGVRLMTRMGITDVSKACESRWLGEIGAECKVALDAGITPIFEWTSPKNRIVVGYPEDRLVLLALRTTKGGLYLEDGGGFLPGIARPKTLATDAHGDWQKLAAHVEGLEGEEGYVVWFDDGRAVKVKAPWYVTRHRALDGLRFEHHVVKMLLGGAADDVRPLLTADDCARLDGFDEMFGKWVADQSARAAVAVDDVIASGGDRKAVAMAVNRSLPAPLRAVAFKYADGDAPTIAMRRAVERAAGNQTKLADLLTGLNGPRWEPA